jgi:hypothetical protein
MDQYHAEGGFEAKDSAEARGSADRTATIRAEMECAQPQGSGAVKRCRHDLDERNLFLALYRSRCRRLSARGRRRPIRFPIKNRARWLCRARERNVCVFCQNDPMTDHAFFFKPARIASAVIGMCRTRMPTAL